MDSFFIFYFFIPQTTTFHFIYRPISHIISYIYNILYHLLSHIFSHILIIFSHILIIFSHILIISFTFLWILVVCGFYFFIFTQTTTFYFISSHISPFMDSCSLWILFFFYSINHNILFYILQHGLYHILYL